MAIIGPDPRRAAVVTGPSAAGKPEAAAAAATSTATKPSAGWAPGQASRPQVSVPAASPRPKAADVQATLPNPVRQSLRGSVERFTARVETALGHDPMSIARGKTPVREGDPLTAAQQTELSNATTELIKDLPLGALSPQLAETVTQKLKDAGLQTRDLASTKLKDLGSFGADIAKGLVKDLVNDLKESSPTTYYSLGATLAAGIGYTAWNDGSAKLGRLGVKPEVKRGFLDGALELKLAGDWKAHFKDFNTTATATGRLDLGAAGRVSASATASSSEGLEHAQVQHAINRQTWDLSTTATVNRAGLQTVGASASWRPQDNLRLSASVNRDLQTDRTTANAEVAWQVKPQVDFALSASHDSAGASRIGAGVRVRF